MPPTCADRSGWSAGKRVSASSGRRASCATPLSLCSSSAIASRAQHREILTLAGWIALLITCVEYDSGDRQAAETTRQAALGLGTEADHAEIRGWAHEIRAWIDDLTTGNYHCVVAAARTGIEVVPRHGVAIQLAAQEAKAWARIGGPPGH